LEALLIKERNLLARRAGRILVYHEWQVEAKEVLDRITKPQEQMRGWRGTAEVERTAGDIP